MVKTPKLPPDKIVVKNGQVIRIEEWTLWNLQPWCCITITRQEDEFLCNISEPEHGGGTTRGKSIEKAVSQLHPDISAPFIQAFKISNATRESLKEIFPKHKIIFN